MRKHDDIPRDILLTWIGKQVVKNSGKPFKSGDTVNTVKGLTTNLQTGNSAFTFEEDESNVECWRCKLL
jgi:hypothetical protein